MVNAGSGRNKRNQGNKFYIEDMVYTEFAVALSEDRKNLKQMYISDTRPALTHLTLKMEEQSRYICLLLSDKEPGVRKIDVYA